ncbi:alkaline phosphatase [Flavobacterium araucananum]|uniref:Alkaline phosphatase n=1 Tax=Flavobacterium araucananum TaxID=946678 RepID=A0A227NV20_9FLAO|nr:alkaline phosphatase [Flavobacterium araucananum]OXG00868.1 alkaline phosphatase [Flavobacterium araucananum]PWK03221.1 alkaline phosphatase [Flavobacterium araucananum]
MNRRKFFKNGSLLTIGAAVMNPFQSTANILDLESTYKNKKAKNIILLVSDGMSTGTLNMADLFLNRKTGKGSNWIQLYKDNRVSRALMDTASASSIVTDSSAASSSWGGGFRVNNGVLNVSPQGEPHLPLWQKFKKSGKMAGCVTTVPITHATPAGFCVNSKSRNAQDDIAEQYLDLGFDVMMGGGSNYFSPESRKDKKDMFAAFKAKGYQVVKTRSDMEAASNAQPILGVFAEDGLPYYVDRNSDENLQKNIPGLAEMAQKAIDRMKNHKNGFVLQIESGKVDWAAHGNDIAGLINDQIEFDEAVKIAIDFAEKDKETLVIITTDHGNANPGIIYGKDANDNFDSIQKYTQTNEWILNQIKPESSVVKVKEIIEKANGHSVSDEEAKTVLSYYDGLHKEDGLYNYKKLPYKAFAEMQGKINSVGWISMDHSADYVELAMFGPGSELLKPFVKNTDLHYLMLQAAEVENKF